MKKLTSRGFLDGYWYKPRIDKELLAEHSEGIVAMTQTQPHFALALALSSVAFGATL